MIEEVTRDTVTYNHPPHRFEAGTPPIVQAIGLAAALDYVEGIGRSRIRAHEEAVSAYAHERLSSINSLQIIGTAPGKGPILSFTMHGAHAHDVATLIDRSGVAVRAGTHCAMPLMQRFGVTSTCRASFALYNTFAEIDALADALERAQKLLPEGGGGMNDVHSDAALARSRSRRLRNGAGRASRPDRLDHRGA